MVRVKLFFKKSQNFEVQKIKSKENNKHFIKVESIDKKLGKISYFLSKFEGF